MTLPRLVAAFALAAAHVVLAAAPDAFVRPLERVASMDPLRAAAAYDARAVQLVYETPLEVDYAARPYRLVPGACELPQISADGLELVFRLRGTSRFVDDACFPGERGRPVVAEDVAWSLRRLADRANASSGMWIMDSVASVDALDPISFRVRLKRRNHVFPWLMALPYAGITPREAVEKQGARFGAHAVGSGPYRLAEWRRNHRMVFERNPSWTGWGANPAPFGKIEYLVVDDASTQWLMFLAGEMDFLGEIARDNWDAVVDREGRLDPELASRGVRLESAPALEVMYAGMNMRDPVLGKNRKLRQALNCAFDFPAWNRFLNGRARASDGPVPPGVAGHLDEPFAYAFDLEKSKRLLVEAGYPGGVDRATGRRLKLTLAIGRANQTAREQAELIQAFYARVGLRLEPVYYTWNAFLDAVNEGRVQLYLMGWVGDYPDAENFLQMFHSKNLPPGANHSNYVNPEFDRLYDAAMAAPTELERLALWCRAQAILREDCPWVFLHFPMAYSLVGPRVGNYVQTDFPYGVEKHFRALAADTLKPLAPKPR